MEGQYNLRSPAVKRLMREAQELREPTEQYFAQPLDDNLFEWHFTLRGPADSEFEGGIYHGRIVLPPDYPMKPPSIILLTPNGRFECYKKICLSISGHHPESWQPSWSIRTALLAIIGFMPTHGSGAIGSLDYTPEERKVLAKKSKDCKCPTCGDVSNILKPVTEASEETKREAKELASQINFQGEKDKGKSESGGTSSTSAPQSPSAADGATGTTVPEASAPNTNPDPSQPPQFNPFASQGLPQGALPPGMPPPFLMPYMLNAALQQANGNNPNAPNVLPPFPPNLWPPNFPLTSQAQDQAGAMPNFWFPPGTAGAQPNPAAFQYPLWPPGGFPPGLGENMQTGGLSTASTESADQSEAASTSNTATPTEESKSSTEEPLSAPISSSSSLPSSSDSTPTVATIHQDDSTDNTEVNGQSQPAPHTDEVLRQRNVAQENVPDSSVAPPTSTSVAPPTTTSVAPPTTTESVTHQPAELPVQQAHRASNDTWSLIAIVILGLAITILVGRRLYLQNYWRFDYDA